MVEIGHADDGDERHQGTHPYNSYHFILSMITHGDISEAGEPLLATRRAEPYKDADTDHEC